MFKNLGKIKYKVKTNKVKIKIKDVKIGINYIKDFIIYKNADNIAIYDRICDHNGGKLISKNNKTICPMHNWEFIPEKGKYTNGLLKKKKSFEIIKNEILVKENTFEPIIKSFKRKTKIKVRYINHAFLIIESDNFKFATDPWALGPAFNTGWWLKHKTIVNWKEELNSCDFIYVSHNHPDHCHELTLSYIKKNIPIIVPNFVTNSVGLLLNDLGFDNIKTFNFEDQYQFKNTNLIITLFKSGDLREDSGLYFSAGLFKGLLTVDANNLNFLKLPKVDLFAASFAGGAHGYPLNCENYDLKDRIKMLKIDRKFIKQTKMKYLEKIKPTFFLPYAGFFEERLKQDEVYKKYNTKNTVNDYRNFCEKKNIRLLDVEEKNIFNFNGLKKFVSKKYNGNYYVDLNEKKYLNYFIKKYDKIDLNYIKNYFINSKFHDDTKLYISLTNNNFKLSYLNFMVTFKKKITFRIIKSDVDKILKKDNNFLYLKIRKEAFLNTIYNRRSWEDISIGFQNKQFRKPNKYNANFWFHFTNVNVNKKFIKSTTECAGCTTLKQDIDSILFAEKVITHKRINFFK